jgi:hypothetical protein
MGGGYYISVPPVMLTFSPVDIRIDADQVA